MWNWKVLIVGKNMISSLFACLRRRPRGRRPHKSAHKGCSVENFELLEKEKILFLPEATNLVGLCDGRVARALGAVSTGRQRAWCDLRKDKGWQRQDNGSETKLI
ncbi:hypothetical protein GEV33_015054 [Tenebrio molitor]|uniref:Uncharacterized protein n=1 Tax=Tenebrio molitor TaxID=7067 RepID=A0A8J6H5P4_TENMO|nr:hypothetical protein GEV33_015054 [Tenebrio molitor]